MTAEVILSGLQVPEGPAVLHDGRVVFTEQTRGAVSIYDGGSHEVLASTGGAPNSAAVGSGGKLYICQNGGTVGAWRSPDPRTPGIQEIDTGGTVRTLTHTVQGMPLTTPNDLAFGPDGRLYFTDPAQPFDLADRRDTGKLFALGDGMGELVRHVGPVYCNGIAFAGDGGLIWVESYTRQVKLLDPHNRVERLLATLPAGHVPDGIAVATDGRIFIASCDSHGIDVIGPDGTDAGFLTLDDEAVPSNLCFDGSVLWVTDFGTDYAEKPGGGRLWRVQTDAVGQPVHVGSVAAGPDGDPDPLDPASSES